MSTQTVEQTDQDTDVRLGSPRKVVLYNCECHTFDQVIHQLQKATGCSVEEADRIALEVHTTGRSIAYSGTAEECERVAAILRQIKLQVEIDTA